MKRRTLARHALFYDDEVGAHSTDNILAASSTDLAFGMRCALHSGSSAIQWSMSKWSFSGAVEDLHIAIKSLKNSSAEFCSKLTRCTRSCEDCLQLFDVCRVLGVPHEFADELVAVNALFDPVEQVLDVAGVLF